MKDTTQFKSISVNTINIEIPTDCVIKSMNI